MRALKIADGDLVLNDRGEFEWIKGVEEEEQVIERCLSTNQGEWFLNVLHGLDYQALFAKPFDEERATLAVVEAISQEPRVERVEKVEFSFNRPDRHMEIRVEVKMINGNTVEGVIPIE